MATDNRSDTARSIANGPARRRDGRVLSHRRTVLSMNRSAGTSVGGRLFERDPLPSQDDDYRTGYKLVVHPEQARSLQSTVSFFVIFITVFRCIAIRLPLPSPPGGTKRQLVP